MYGQLYEGSGTEGKTGGIVIKQADEDNLMTVCNIAVPLTTLTAMASEVAGATVLTQTLDLPMTNNLSRYNIVSIIDETTCETM